MISHHHRAAGLRHVFDAGRLDSPVVAIELLEQRPPHLPVERIASELVDRIVPAEPALNQFEVALQAGLVAERDVVVESISKLGSFLLLARGSDTELVYGIASGLATPR